MKFNGYDIYGSPLKTGHCEVHPHVGFEYPCPECKNEQDDAEAQFQAYKDYYKGLEYAYNESQAGLRGDEQE